MLVGFKAALTRSINNYAVKAGLLKKEETIEGDDCREVLNLMSVQPPYPSAQGLVFNTDFFHAMRACNDEVPLTWKQLWPYLSAQGRKVAELFQR